MKKYPIAIQIHCLREDFAEKPAETLLMIKEMGYDGIEINIGNLKLDEYPIEQYKAWLDEAGLECYSMMLKLENFAEEKKEENESDTISFENKAPTEEEMTMLEKEAEKPKRRAKIEYENLQFGADYDIKSGK